MSALHLIYAPAAVYTCLKAVAPGDAVLLAGDGAFAGADERLATSALPVMVIAEDASSRGVVPATSVTPVTYEDFVALVVRHDVSVTWA